MAQAQKAKKAILTVCCMFFFFAMTSSSLYAIDSELTRQTLLNIRGVMVVVEDLQPNIQKYAHRFGLTRDQLKKDIEQRLIKSGIIVLDQERWLKTPDRPVPYININTHEYEKYWYAYNIIVDLRQLVRLEANPDMKALASTWSVNMVGIANIGSLNTVKNNAGILVDRFIEARQPPPALKGK
jgi:hypothetical protein